MSLREKRKRGRSANHEKYECLKEGLETKVQFLEDVSIGRVIKSGDYVFFGKTTTGLYNKLPVLIKFINNEFLMKYFPLGAEFETVLPFFEQELKRISEHENIMKYQGLLKTQNVYAIVLSLPKINLCSWLESEADEYHFASLPASEHEFIMRICTEVSAVHALLASKRMVIGVINAARVYLSYNVTLARLEACVDVYSEIFVSKLLCNLFDCKIPTSEKVCILDYGFCSPEVLLRGRYNLASDVWSFGVFIWELWNLGATPYLSILDTRSPESIQTFVEYICAHDSKRLALPHLPDLNNIIAQCLSLSPSDRPSAKTIHNLLVSIAEKNKQSKLPASTLKK